MSSNAYHRVFLVLIALIFFAKYLVSWVSTVFKKEMGKNLQQLYLQGFQFDDGIQQYTPCGFDIYVYTSLEPISVILTEPQR
jgi:hypothetical protein